MQNALQNNVENTDASVTASASLLHGGAGSNGKRPKKGILKSSSSFDRTGGGVRKSAKFDELNVLQTFHPLDKDYGHMRIDEPKTPFHYGDQDTQQDQLDAELLAEKLRIAANTQTPSFDDDGLSDDEFEETAEEKARRLEFEKRRKEHYKEFEAVKLARKLIEEELADVDDDDDNNVNLVEIDKSITEVSSKLLQYEDETAGVEINSSGAVRPNIAAPVESSVQRNSETFNFNIMDVDQPLPPKHPCHDEENL